MPTGGAVTLAGVCVVSLGGHGCLLTAPSTAAAASTTTTTPTTTTATTATTFSL